MPNSHVIFDGHNDVLMGYAPVGTATLDSFFQRNDDRQIDYPRAQESRFGGGFFAVYVPSDNLMDMINNIGSGDAEMPPALSLEHSQQVALSMMANLFRLEDMSNGRFKVVRTTDELESCLNQDVMAAIFHIEGAEAIDEDLHALEVFYQAGLRSLGMVWSRPTIFGYGVPFRIPHSPDIGPGLTDAGKRLVRRCNQLGILIDVSHLNEKGFWDVANLTDAPLVATHSNAHALCPLTRNLTDKQLDAIKESDGMVGLNLVVMFLHADGRNDLDVPMDVIIRHIDYLVEKVGIDRVGFGADMSLPDIPIPREIADVTGYPKIIAALSEAGYDDASLRKIAHENWLRVLRKTWK